MQAVQETDIIMATSNLASMRLFQLISPSLPTGAFTYSQGLEWAIECGWVNDDQSLAQWLDSILHSSFAELELPVLRRLYDATENDHLENFKFWCSYIVASRETSELRSEENNRGRAMVKIIKQLDIECDNEWLAVMQDCQLAGFAFMAVRWRIGLQDAARGYVWSWLENMVMAAAKTVPLGQAAGQRVLARLSRTSVDAVIAGMDRKDNELGGGCPAFAISSSLHETQYTRLFRS